MIGANLYSLQSVILQQLQRSAREDEVWRIKMNEVHEQIEGIFENDTGDKLGRFMQIKKPLLTMWYIRDSLAKAFMYRRPELAFTLKDVFSRLPHGIKGKHKNPFLEYKVRPPPSHFSDDNSTCCSCTIL